VIPIVIAALGTIPRGLEENLRTLGITIKVELIHRVALLRTARILRKVLENGQKTGKEKRWYVEVPRLRDVVRTLAIQIPSS